MIADVIVQAILDGLGTVLAFLYSVVGNYGVAIILLTLAIRLLLLPLGLKQIRSMQAMQQIQPKVKALQQKYKGNRQKLNEETMRLYKEHGVNPLSGCLPLLAQFPVLIALYLVIQFPNGLTHTPRGSDLENAIKTQRTYFLTMNMLCSAQQAGTQVTFPEGQIPQTRADVTPRQLDCGTGVPVRIPYYLLAIAMVGTTYYQQRQMQRASPPGASQQQQTLMRVMPLLFGVWGFFFPSGLVLYWTTTNLVQILQQRILLRTPPPVPVAAPGASAKPRPAGGDGQVKKPSTRTGGSRAGKQAGADQRKSPGRSTGRSSSAKGLSSGGAGPRPAGGQGSKGGGGGRNAGDRKKRRKR